MKKGFISAVAALAMASTAFAQTAIHVSPSGDDNGAGTAEAPFASIEKALEAVQPGGTIYVHAGTYYPTKRIRVPAKDTNENARIRLFGAGDGEAIIDGSKMTPASELEFKGSRCMYFGYDANYWHVRDLTFQNALDNGVKVEGSYNIFERCIFRGNNDTGLQIGMFKDWSIEETKSFPIKGTPEFNPGYTYCRGNKVINCDSYNNYDAVAYGGKSDDGGDADGFACKLFPGPGTEFHGCRAWNNSDDNWDLYMVYHPVIIDNCYAWNAALDKDGNKTPGNGNGFKLGGGGSSGGAAFDQSTGAHVVRNCVSFSNTVKGFDQNNAYEGMYLFNNLAWDNEYNYRFPTAFKFGKMYIRNCVGFLPRKLNHEFLSVDKDGYVEHDTRFNSWTTIDGCDAIKDGNKVDKTKVYAADHSAEYLSLAIEDAKADRLPDGSLPENNFARLKAGSIFVDAGEAIENFIPTRHMTEAEAAGYGLELVQAAPVTIEYNGAAPDFGPFESGTPSAGRLYLMTDNAEQIVYQGTEIEPIVLKWSGAATDVTVAGAKGLAETRDNESKTVTLSGIPSESQEITVTTVGGESSTTLTIKINVSTIAPGTITCTTSNLQQTAFFNESITPITFEYGGGATGFRTDNLLPGLTEKTEGNKLIISGVPAEAGSFTVTAIGGMTEVSLTVNITLEIANRILTGDWYNIQEELENVHADLRGIVSLEQGPSYTTTWNPTRTESGTVPGGCTEGAVDVERGGALVWTLPSLLELKANIHFTGGRYLTIKWQRAGEAEQTWVSDKLSKQTMAGWDLMKAAGIEPTPGPITVKFINDGGKNNGGIRVYDFFVKVYRDSMPGSVAQTVSEPEISFYRMEGALLADRDDITMMQLIAMDGSTLSTTLQSQVLPLNGAEGVVIVRATLRDGCIIVKKLVL